MPGGSLRIGAMSAPLISGVALSLGSVEYRGWFDQGRSGDDGLSCRKDRYR